MTPQEAIDDACIKYISAVFRAKEVSASVEAFWANGRAERAYRRMFKVIEETSPADLKWQFAIWELAGSTAERVW